MVLQRINSTKLLYHPCAEVCNLSTLPPKLKLDIHMWGIFGVSSAFIVTSVLKMLRKQLLGHDGNIGLHETHHEGHQL